ncbi:MAG TPA: HAMP domain-containing sensor histidine kinase [Candidatus Baltobacteraceae bacterium]|nr:HAMP domain-containing sensor histidine kinase [Candidatus Baltobacteraceae bacterium]
MKRPSPNTDRALPVVPVLCYVLLIVAWAIDLVTPQLFVAAILLNGPIALSGLALSTRLTASLVILAEVANVVAGYVNGVQAHYHWDSIAIGDRILSAASFLLVGYLTTRAQEYAREAGSATERSRIAQEEKHLRRALETVRSSLNVDLVLRSIVREALKLSGGTHAMLIVRRSQLEVPDIYRIAQGSADADLQRIALDSPLSSVVTRATNEVAVSTRERGDPVAHMVLDSENAQAMAYVRISGAEEGVVLLVLADEFRRGAERALQAFAEGSSVALGQAWLFMQLGYRNEQIAKQKEALEERSRVIRDIVYALAHDLRTPLSAANATMQQALDGAYGELPQAYRGVLHTALASNADLRHLVETLLMVARFESGESSTLRERVDVEDAVGRVARELHPIADVKHVQIQLSRNGAAPGTAAPAILADPAELRRAVSNLVANAIEASPEGANVGIRIEGDADNVRIVVEDEGYGIPEEQRSQLFTRFAPGARTLGSGTGLGLYIVRLIAEKLGGTVAYAPHEPRGSTFSVTLPTAPS